MKKFYFVFGVKLLRNLVVVYRPTVATKDIIKSYLTGWENRASKDSFGQYIVRDLVEANNSSEAFDTFNKQIKDQTGMQARMIDLNNLFLVDFVEEGANLTKGESVPVRSHEQLMAFVKDCPGCLTTSSFKYQVAEEDDGFKMLVQTSKYEDLDKIVKYGLKRRLDEMNEKKKDARKALREKISEATLLVKRKNSLDDESRRLGVLLQSIK